MSASLDDLLSDRISDAIDRRLKGVSLSAPPLAYRPKTAAAATGFSLTRIHELIASGEIKARKDGRNTVILHDDLARFIASLPERESA